MLKNSILPLAFSKKAYSVSMDGNVNNVVRVSGVDIYGNNLENKVVFSGLKLSSALSYSMQSSSALFEVVMDIMDKYCFFGYRECFYGKDAVIVEGLNSCDISMRFLNPGYNVGDTLPFGDGDYDLTVVYVISMEMLDSFDWPVDMIEA